MHYTQRVESRPVHSIFTPKEVITDVTTKGVTSVTNRVKIHSMFLESIVMGSTWLLRRLCGCYGVYECGLKSS